MVFPENGVINQLLSHGKEIVGVPYNWRKLPLRSTAVPIDTKMEKQEDLVIDPATLPTELFECRTVGTGLLLIDLSVFEKIPEPWFDFIRNPNGDLQVGEDSYFCLKAQEAGFKVYADPTVRAQHCGDYLY